MQKHAANERTIKVNQSQNTRRFPYTETVNYMYIDITTVKSLKVQLVVIQNQCYLHGLETKSLTILPSPFPGANQQCEGNTV